MKSLASLGHQVPDFSRCASQKLQQLLTTGYRINGVSIERHADDGTVTHGAITAWGRVLWWHPAQPAAVVPPSAGALLRRALPELLAYRSALTASHAYGGVEAAPAVNRVEALIADIRRTTGGLPC